MLRSLLISAALLFPAAAMSDKLVNADGDSFIESASEAGPGLLDVLSPVTPAEAAERSAEFALRPAASVTEMAFPGYEITHEFDGYYVGVPGDTSR